VLAIVLAATGIHGLAAYAVSRRTREIGVRMALGAQPIQVVRLVLGKDDVAARLGLGRGVDPRFGSRPSDRQCRLWAQPRDPLVLLSVWGSIALIAFSAAWSPARRATRVDPLVALRYE